MHLRISVSLWLLCFVASQQLTAQVEVVSDTSDGPVVVTAIEDGRLMRVQDGESRIVGGDNNWRIRPAKEYSKLTGRIGLHYAIHQFPEILGWSPSRMEVRVDLTFEPDIDATDVYFFYSWEVDGKVVSSAKGKYPDVKFGEVGHDSRVLHISEKDKRGELRGYLFQSGKSLPGVSKEDFAIRPFFSAVENGDYELATQWLRGPGLKEVLPHDLLERVARTGDAKLLEAALDHMSDKGFNRRKADEFLRAAAGAIRPQSVKLLLEKKVNPNSEDRWGETALHYASLTGDLEVMELLLEGGANPKKGALYGQNTMETVLMKNNPDAARLLLKHKARWVSRSFETDSMNLATANNWGDMVEFLIQQRVDPDGDSEKPPLIITAARHEDGRILQLLLDAGAKLDVAEEDGFTPLMSAVNAGATTPIAILRKRGVSLTTTDKKSRTAAAWALVGFNSDLAVELLREAPLKGAAASQVLHDALLNRDEAVLEIILEQGAVLNPSAEDIDLVLDQVVQDDRLSILEAAWDEGTPINPTLFDSWNLAGVVHRYGKKDILNAMRERLGRDPSVVIPQREKLPIQVAKRGAAFTPEKLGDDVEHAEAKIDLYIDAKGMPRFPVIRSASSPDMGLAAVDYIKGWRFSALDEDETAWRRVVIPVIYSAEAFSRDNIVPSWKLDAHAKLLGESDSEMNWSEISKDVDAAWVHYSISDHGKVHSPRVFTSTRPELNSKVMEIVRGWRYLPARKDGADVWSDNSGVILLPSGQLLPKTGLISSRSFDGEGEKPPKLTRSDIFFSMRAKAGEGKARGLVIIRFVAKDNGFVYNAKVLAATDTELGKQALKACEKFEFAPAEIDGVPQSATMLWVLRVGDQSDSSRMNQRQIGL